MKTHSVDFGKESSFVTYSGHLKGAITNEKLGFGYRLRSCSVEVKARCATITPTRSVDLLFCINIEIISCLARVWIMEMRL